MLKGRQKEKVNSDIAKEWDKLAHLRLIQLENAVDISMDNIIIPTISNLITNTDNSDVIDLGCGTGYATKIFAKFCNNITGIDISKKSILEAQKNSFNNVKFINSSIENFALFNKGFTLAISNMTFMDVANLEKVIASTSELLKENGHLIITITHPCFWPFYWNYHDKEWFNYSKEIEIEDFFKITNSKTNYKTTHFHRPLEMYINTLINNFFKIEIIQEPMPNDQQATLYATKWKFPRFLAMKCVKEKR